MDVKTIRELSRLMRDYDLVELEVESEDLKLRLSKAGSGSQLVAAPMPMAAAPAATATPAGSTAPGVEAEDEFAGCKKIVSPIPGTVYLKPNPESDNFVSVGGAVKTDDVVCLVEAMKVFNEIKAEGVTGTIKKVCVEDGQPVEYGTVLFLVA